MKNQIKDDNKEIGALTSYIRNLKIQISTSEQQIQEIRERQNTRWAKGQRRRSIPRDPKGSKGNRLRVGDRVQFWQKVGIGRLKEQFWVSDQDL